MEVETSETSFDIRTMQFPNMLTQVEEVVPGQKGVRNRDENK